MRAALKSRLPAFLLGAATFLLASVLFGAAADPPVSDLPNSAAQRKEMIAALHQQTEKLSQIVILLREIRDDARPAAAPGGPGRP